MSPNRHYEIDRVQQYEIDAREIRARHAHVLPASSRHSVKFRIGPAVAAVGVCAAISTALVVGGAPANPRPAHHGTRVSAQQVSREIRALEHKGYVQYSCTINGTEMRNLSTGRVITVSTRD